MSVRATRGSRAAGIPRWPRARRPVGIAVRVARWMRTAAIVLVQRKQARERLAAAQRRLEAAKGAFEAESHDVTYKRYRDAEVEHDDALAVAQEWALGVAVEVGPRW